MKKDRLSFFAWYPKDYRADTLHLPPEADLAYRCILDEIFLTNQEGQFLVDDDEYLRAVSRCSVRSWPRVRHLLIDGQRPMFQKRDGKIHSDRLGKEIRKAQGKSEAARSSASYRWNDAEPMRTHSERIANALPTHSERGADEKRTECEGNAIKSKSKDKEETKGKRESRTRSLVPEDFSPDEKTLDYCRTKFPYLDVSREVDAFVAYYRSEGTLTPDAQMLFKRWVIRSDGFKAKEKQPNLPTHSPTPTRESDPNTIRDTVLSAMPKIRDHIRDHGIPESREDQSQFRRSTNIDWVTAAPFVAMQEVS